jgi:glycosyltransferase involved in cell wall biosynthesis
MGAEIPFSIWLHAGIDLYSDRVFLREKLLYADRIITCIRFNAEFLKEVYPDIWSVLEPKLHVHYHGLDLDTFGYDPSGRPPARVLAVGKLYHTKGFHHLIRAAAILVESGRELEVELVGGGEEADNLRELARELGIANRVTFSGWVPEGQVREAMCRATVLAHPSTGLGDGLPNVIREAMALGTPVVASSIAGIPEALDDGCGVLVPPQDPGALAQALGELLDDPGRRRRIADAARKRTESLYDQWANGRALAAVLKSTTRHSSAATSDR